MVRYVKLFNEFIGFVKDASPEITDEYEKRLINLIVDHFDEVVETGTAQGKRGQLLNELLQQEGASVSDCLRKTDSSQIASSYPFSRLKGLTVADFRGFSDEETIHLDKKYTFVYGPNGSGKSCFCEALEYALLGYINEAIARRIDIGRYVQNMFTGTTRPPILRAVDVNGEEFQIKANPLLYNFCFIEKNRIEDFGRISANTPNDKKSILASIFGLEEFSEFVANFTTNIDKYIDTVGRKNLELEDKSRGLQVHKDNLQASQDTFNKLTGEKKECAADSGLPLPFDELDSYIHGTESKEGRLKEIDQLLEKESPRQVNYVSSAEMADRVRLIVDDAGKAKELLEHFRSLRNRVCFRKLYATAVELEEYENKKCPLCETPIERAAVNPFDNARKRLLELADIAKMEADIETLTGKVHQSLVEMNRCLSIRKRACTEICVDYPGPEENLTVNDLGTKFPALLECAESMASQWDALIEQSSALDARIDNHNTSAKQQAADRQRLVDEKRKLDELSLKIVKIKTNIDGEQNNITRYEKAINEFKSANAGLIKEAEEEKPVIKQNQKYVAAYSTFLDRLTRYKDELPTRHLKELNDLTLEIYNSFNDGDPRYEKAARIDLPAALDDPIKIFFSDDPTRELDALHILSEGHVRCLGLAILMAKNIQLDCPLIVFDDVVNAIDDDHRGAIRQFIRKSPRLLAKQIIVTTHSEQFVQDIEHDFTHNDYNKQVHKLGFRLDQNGRRLRIKDDMQENYIVKINKALDNAQWREALDNCRCELESLTHKLWKKIGNAGYKTDFSVVIRSPNKPPDLMSVVLSLNRSLKKDKEERIPRCSEICTIFDFLLGLNSKNQVEWNYLNKGTHEEEGRLPFDHIIVREIACKMESLDTHIKS